VKPTRATFAAAAALVLAGAALAQDDASRPDILGSWAFEAAVVHDESCTFAGEVFIRRGVSPDHYLCEMVANDVCPGNWAFRAEQTCTATRSGDQLSIQSRITKLEPSSGNYLPDNFELQIVDGSLMVGELRSAMIASARFYRTVGPIS
jgi:hypothetical protein